MSEAKNVHANVQVLGVEVQDPIVPEDYGRFDIVDLILKNAKPENGDIIFLSSKVVSILEGRSLELNTVVPSKRSKVLAKRFKIDPHMVELVKSEGSIRMMIPSAKFIDYEIGKYTLAQMKPGVSHERVLKKLIKNFNHVMMVPKYGYMADSAGIDDSNLPAGWVTRLPEDAEKSAETIRKQIMLRAGLDSLGIVITDTLGFKSGTLGHWDTPISYSGFQALERNLGCDDIFGIPIMGSRANYLLPLTSMAGMVMGSTAEMTPIAIIRGFNYEEPLEEQGDKGQTVAAISIPQKAMLPVILRSLVSTVGYYIFCLRLAFIKDDK